MSLRTDGTYRCDRCGTDIGNAGVDVAATISDLVHDEHNHPIPGRVRVLHLCRKNGCVTRVLTKRALANLKEIEQ